MTEIKVAIEGEDAAAAAEELLAIEGISGTWEPLTETRKDSMITVIVTALVAPVVTNILSQKILEWHQKHLQRTPKARIEKVLIIGRNGRRVVLKDASLEEIRQILED